MIEPRKYFGIVVFFFQLDDLGGLCGLMPGSSPTETELQTVCMLQSSIGKMQGEGQMVIQNA